MASNKYGLQNAKKARRAICKVRESLNGYWRIRQQSKYKIFYITRKGIDEPNAECVLLTYKPNETLTVQFEDGRITHTKYKDLTFTKDCIGIDLSLDFLITSISDAL